ncbi:MAG: hypothetical protein H0M93_00225, partial [Methanophagales archaeon]|nr:hypothetical protein [Methanophagales archaeon]
MVDAQHIAIATVSRVDILVSWNFRHIVNLTKIRLYNSVNLKYGYPLLEIRSPREVCFMKDKKFDAVRMMREIRDKLSKRYSEDPEAEKRDLE